MDQSFLIREFEPTDAEYAAIAEIGNRSFSEYLESAGEIRHNDDNWDHSKHYLKRYVAVEPESGRIAGFVVANQDPSYFQPERCTIWINVDLDYQHQGIGTLLYDYMVAELRAHGFTILETTASERMPEVVAFLSKRGFVETARDWESRLDPRGFDPAPLQHYAQQVAQHGISIVTLAQEQASDPAWLPRLYDLHTKIVADVPAPVPYTAPDIELFRRQQLEHPTILPDAYFIARHGDLYVGESYLEITAEDSDSVFQGYTGVRREYRGKGIAIALKLVTVEYARAHGYSMIKTWNSTINTGMLAINERMGFVRQPAWIQLEKGPGAGSRDTGYGRRVTSDE